MCTATRPRKPVIRLARLQGSALGLQVGNAAFVYRLEDLAADFGVGIRLLKYEPVRDHAGNLVRFVETKVYNVNLDGQRSTCECIGFLRWGRCKHVRSLLALQAAGRLAGALAVARAQRVQREAQQRAREWQAALAHCPALARRILAVLPCS